MPSLIEAGLSISALRLRAAVTLLAHDPTFVRYGVQEAIRDTLVAPGRLGWRGRVTPRRHAQQL